METGVVVGADPVGRLANEEQRSIGDVVDGRVAHIWDVFLSAGQLPDPTPEPFDLQIVELA
jgi:hypothetical protein